MACACSGWGKGRCHVAPKISDAVCQYISAELTAVADDLCAAIDRTFCDPVDDGPTAPVEVQWEGGEIVLITRRVK